MEDKHYLHAELRRLQNIRNKFASEIEYLKYVGETLDTLKKFDVIHDSHVLVSENRILISVQIPTITYETLNLSYNR